MSFSHLRFEGSAAVFSAALLGFGSAIWWRPWRKESTSEEFCAHLRERSEKRIIRRRAAKAFANWIHPDIPGDSVKRIRGTQDTLVVFELPEMTMCASGELYARVLLEGFDEFDQVAFVRCTCGEQMHVVRHDAICMDEKRAKAGMFSQAGDEP